MTEQISNKSRLLLIFSHDWSVMDQSFAGAQHKKQIKKMDYLLENETLAYGSMLKSRH